MKHLQNKEPQGFRLRTLNSPSNVVHYSTTDQISNPNYDPVPMPGAAESAMFMVIALFIFLSTVAAVLVESGFFPNP